MNILLIFPGFIVAFIIVLCYEYKIKELSIKPKNNIHFYVARVFDWLNKYHFDYRDLIQMSLAIAVTKENNTYE